MFGRLLILFIGVPLIELVLFLTLGQKLGLPLTLMIIILTGFLGASLAKSQGQKAFYQFRHTMQEGSLPHKEVADGILILLAGAVLLTPGFLTDALGFALLIPTLRSLLYRLLTPFIQKHIIKTPFPVPGSTTDQASPHSSPPRSFSRSWSASSKDDQVIDV